MPTACEPGTGGNASCVLHQPVSQGDFDAADLGTLLNVSTYANARPGGSNDSMLTAVASELLALPVQPQLAVASSVSPDTVTAAGARCWRLGCSEQLGAVLCCAAQLTCPPCPAPRAACAAPRCLLRCPQARQCRSR